MIYRRHPIWGLTRALLKSKLDDGVAAPEDLFVPSMGARAKLRFYETITARDTELYFSETGRERIE